MSVLDRVRGSLNIGKTVTASPETIATRLDELKEQRRRLELKLGAAVLDGDDGEDGVAGITEAIVTVDRTIRGLTASHGEAVRRSELEARVAAENAFIERRIRVEKHMAKAMAALRRAAEGVPTVAAAYNDGWQAFQKAYREAAAIQGIDLNQAGFVALQAGADDLFSEAVFTLTEHPFPASKVFPFRTVGMADFEQLLADTEDALKRTLDAKLADLRGSDTGEK